MIYLQEVNLYIHIYVYTCRLTYIHTYVNMNYEIKTSLEAKTEANFAGHSSTLKKCLKLSLSSTIS